MCRKRERDYIYIIIYIHSVYIYLSIYLSIFVCVSVCVYALSHFIKVGGKKATRSVMICAMGHPTLQCTCWRSPGPGTSGSPQWWPKKKMAET